MEQNPQTKLNKFMSSPRFAKVMNIVRIVFVIWAVGMTIYLFKEIEAVKLLAYDPCNICMAKTGCNCFCATLG